MNISTALQLLLDWKSDFLISFTFIFYLIVLLEMLHLLLVIQTALLVYMIFSPVVNNMEEIVPWDSWTGKTFSFTIT